MGLQINRGKRRGNTTLLVASSQPSYLNLLIEARAEMVSLGRVRWLHTHTRQPMPSPPPVTLFILFGDGTPQEIRQRVTTSAKALAEAFRESGGTRATSSKGLPKSSASSNVVRLGKQKVDVSGRGAAVQEQIAAALGEQEAVKHAAEPSPPAIRTIEAELAELPGSVRAKLAALLDRIIHSSTTSFDAVRSAKAFRDVSGERLPSQIWPLVEDKLRDHDDDPIAQPKRPEYGSKEWAEQQEQRDEMVRNFIFRSYEEHLKGLQSYLDNFTPAQREEIRGIIDDLHCRIGKPKDHREPMDGQIEREPVTGCDGPAPSDTMDAAPRDIEKEPATGIHDDKNSPRSSLYKPAQTSQSKPTHRPTITTATKNAPKRRIKCALKAGCAHHPICRPKDRCMAPELSAKPARDMTPAAAK